MALGSASKKRIRIIEKGIIAIATKIIRSYVEIIKKKKSLTQSSSHKITNILKKTKIA